MTASVLMVQGTASSVGKSVIVTALCRILRQDGLRVAPFKAQNMSNNSYVTASGGEIGRAQVNQAEAAGIEPETDMNPILLKPESDHRSQVVLNGRPYMTLDAGGFVEAKQRLWPYVTSALDRLRERYDAVVIEGAGSPAEINLREADIVNMRVARYASAPVLLVGDIDRGGVFAHLVGTLELLDASERELIRGLVINKFRGASSLLEPGLEMLYERTGVPVAGVIPYLRDLRIAEEDAVALDGSMTGRPGEIDIDVIKLPHIANFDDFDPLQAVPGVSVRYVDSVAALGRPDLIVLPGTKATMADLAWLRERELADAIVAVASDGVPVIGVCGGYQMLGLEIADPIGIESRVPAMAGLGLLNARTVFEPSKATAQVEARIRHAEGLLAGLNGAVLIGYEIHMGRTESAEHAPFRIERRSQHPAASDDGAVSAGGWVLGTYLHGLFANDLLLDRLLRNVAARKGVSLQTGQAVVDKEAAYDRMAAHVRAALDMSLVHELLAASKLGPAAQTVTK
jgi:adenosylcobyric acid synthase